MSKKIISHCLTVILLLNITGCSLMKTENYLDEKDTLNIVSSTTMINDLACVIGGSAVNCIGLMGVGVDPHLFKASASDVSKIANADVILYNGLHLEGEMGEIFSNLSNQGKTVICLEDAVLENRVLMSEDGTNSYDPHIWFDVSIWADCAIYVANILGEISPENKVTFDTNLALYLDQLDNLLQYINDEISKIPQSCRVLITAHDAFNYFGNAYGFKVLALQGISTDLEASTLDISTLSSFIADNKIKSIFLESSVSSKNIESLKSAVLAKGFDVSIGGELYSDSLGDGEHSSYINTFKYNIDTIVNALQ